MKDEIYDERAVFQIKTDSLKNGKLEQNVIEEKYFKSKWDALAYCEKRMNEIRSEEMKKANDEDYDIFGQIVGRTSTSIPKKGDMFDYFVSMGGCRRFLIFIVYRQIYMGRLGWCNRSMVKIPKSPAERKELAWALAV